MFWIHDPSEPIGKWTAAQEDRHGLKVLGKLTLATQRGAEARALAKDGALGLSVGYQTKDSEYRDGARVLKEIKLFEVSLVGLPMNPKAEITSVKSATQMQQST